MEVVRFLTKIQKSEGNSTTLKNWIQKLEGKPTTLKNWIQKMEGNSTTPKNCVLTNFLHERSTIFFLVFSLIRFWIFVRNETLLRIINGSSSFCKGPRTSKVWKSKDPKGLRTLRICLSEDLCKNNYSHLYFAVVTFLTKIQNWCCISKKLVKTQL